METPRHQINWDHSHGGGVGGGGGGGVPLTQMILSVLFKTNHLDTLRFPRFRREPGFDSSSNFEGKPI